MTGSAEVLIALIERMRAELQFDSILTAYGLSEVVVVTMCRREDPPEVISGTAGRVTADCELRIVDVDGRDLAPGEDGEILVRGPNVMLGYLEDPAATAKAIDPDGWLQTGDIGYLDPDGNLVVPSRIKDMFTVGGFNVYPAEVENALLRHPAVRPLLGDRRRRPPDGPGRPGLRRPPRRPRGRRGRDRRLPARAAGQLQGPADHRLRRRAGQGRRRQGPQARAARQARREGIPA